MKIYSFSLYLSLSLSVSVSVSVSIFLSLSVSLHFNGQQSHQKNIFNFVCLVHNKTIQTFLMKCWHIPTTSQFFSFFDMPMCVCVYTKIRFTWTPLSILAFTIVVIILIIWMRPVLVISTYKEKVRIDFCFSPVDSSPEIMYPITKFNVSSHRFM